jgi:hypothetical protein
MKADARLNKTCTPEFPFGLRKRPIACFAALALLAIATPARANLVVNGSFETTTLTGSGQVQFNGDVAGWTTNTSVPLGFLYFPGTSNAQLSDQFGTNNFQLAQGSAPNTIPATSPDSGKFLVLDAAPAYQGSISQSIAGLTVGAKYYLSFYQAAGQQITYTGATTDQWSVTFGNQTLLSTLMNDPAQRFQPWTKQTMAFTASATTQILTFLSQGGPDGDPPMIFLDGVSLVTPEPSSLGYAGMGLAALIAAWRLRSKRT